VYVYEGAGHAFFNDTRDSYRPEAAALAWERTLAFFRNELGGPGEGALPSA
jgi:carboxymethylenebutenolidase